MRTTRNKLTRLGPSTPCSLSYTTVSTPKHPLECMIREIHRLGCCSEAERYHHKAAVDLLYTHLVATHAKFLSRNPRGNPVINPESESVSAGLAQGAAAFINLPAEDPPLKSAEDLSALVRGIHIPREINHH